MLIQALTAAALAIASPANLDTSARAAHPVAMAADPGVTGATITTDQINQVLAFEEARGEADQAIIDDENSTPEQVQAAIDDQFPANGLITICTKALAGNPKDRSKVAALYNSLVVDESIPGA